MNQSPKPCDAYPDRGHLPSPQQGISMSLLRSVHTRALIACLLLTTCAAAENWPRFRGPNGQGVSTESDLPIHWDTTEHVAWNREIPGRGWSSPIVWNDRVFVTTATDDGVYCHVLCLDLTTGDIVWNSRIFEQMPEHKEGKNSYATPTPVTDGNQVYVVFGDGSVAAVNWDGETVWTNRDVKHYSRHGLGASPILHDQHLIMTYDGSNRVAVPGDWPNNSDEERLGWQIPWDRAQIVALDCQTGQRIWAARRGLSRVAHTTPCVWNEDGHSQLISTAGDVIQGFDLGTGERVWSVFSQGEGVVPSAVVGDGLVFTSSGFEATTLRTVRTGGKGDVTESHIAWEQRSGAPKQASLLYYSPHLFTVTDNGIVHCYDGRTGRMLGQQRIGGNFCASPVYGDGHLYFLSEDGITTVVTADPTLNVVARNRLDETCQASPAISQGRLLIRTASRLYCLSKAP